MQLSEEQAKEILEFLASKCNCYLRGFAEMDHNIFMLMLGKNDWRTSKFDYWLYSFSTTSACIPEITTCRASYVDYFDKCLDIASKSYDIFMGCQMFMHKDTTLEQILLEMDMNSL